MLIIPAIDLRRGMVVRLRQGDYRRQTTYHADPVALARDYARLGANWLHLVDLDAAAGEAGASLSLLPRLRSLGLRVQTGGGVRDSGDVAARLRAGAERVVVGTIAARDPARFRRWLARFGAHRLVAALDLDAYGQVRTAAWRQAATRPAAGLLAEWRGLRHVLCTAIHRDGTLEGPDLALYRRLRTRFPALAWQASGGVGSEADLERLAAAGLAAVVVGRALLEGRVTLKRSVPDT